MIEGANSCTVGIGSNSADREYQVKQAIEFLLGSFQQGEVSAVYESAAFNGKDKPYFNAVFHGYTREPYDAVVKSLKDFESQSGRTDVQALEGTVTIDLDLVIWNEHIMRPKDFERHYFNIGYRELLAKGAYEM